MKKNIALIFVFCALFVTYTNAQISSESKLETKQTIYYYTFSGNGNLDELKSSISKLKDVSESKIEYKKERSEGQIRLIVTEKIKPIC